MGGPRSRKSYDDDWWFQGEVERLRIPASEILETKSGSNQTDKPLPDKEPTEARQARVLVDRIDLRSQSFHKGRVPKMLESGASTGRGQYRFRIEINLHRNGGFEQLLFGSIALGIAKVVNANVIHEETALSFVVVPHFRGGRPDGPQYRLNKLVDPVVVIGPNAKHGRRVHCRADENGDKRIGREIRSEHSSIDARLHELSLALPERRKRSARRPLSGMRSAEQPGECRASYGIRQFLERPTNHQSNLDFEIASVGNRVDSLGGEHRLQHQIAFRTPPPIDGGRRGTRAFRDSGNG